LSFERTLWVGHEVFVYKVGPRGPNGYQASNWKEADFIWKGRLRIIEQGDKCEIRLEDPVKGDLFATCPVEEDSSKSVERVTDSSRYYVLRVSSGSKTAFVGMGFQERNDAFDFNVAIEDHVKDVIRRREEKTNPRKNTQQSDQPSMNLGLKDGQTFKVNIRTGGGSRRRDEASGPGVLLPPPNASGRSRDASPVFSQSNNTGFDPLASFGNVQVTPRQAPPSQPQLFQPSPQQSQNNNRSGGIDFGMFTSASPSPTPSAPARAQQAPQQPTSSNAFFADLMSPAPNAAAQKSVTNPLDFLN